MITLPTAKSPVESINPKFLLIYGPRKVGKTTILSQLEDNCILDLEADQNGAGFVSALKIKIYTEQDYREACAEICKHTPRPYKYITVDTVTKLEEWSLNLALRRYKESTVGKNFTGKSILELAQGAWALWLREAFQELLQLSYPCADTIIYTGHNRDKAVEAVGTQVDTKELDLLGKNRALLAQSCDSTAKISRDSSNVLSMNFNSHQNVICGSRCKHLAGRVFKGKADGTFDWRQIFLQTKT